jgi:helix-turn-helix protein
MAANDDRTGVDGAVTQGLTAGPTRGATLREAAEALGISKEAVRKRVKRGTLPHAKGEDGRVYVYLPSGGDAGVDAGGGHDHSVDGDQHLPGERDELIAELRAEVAAWREESRRKDHIIAGLVERLPPQLDAPASPAPRETPQTPAEDAGGVEANPATEDAQEGAQPRSWWRR